MPEDHLYSFIDERLKQRKEGQRLRKLHSIESGTDALRISRNGRELINFCSNDYMGLSKDPRVINKATTYACEFGAGATASRLVSGSFTIHEQLETKLAQTFGTEAALLFNSGFQANSTIIATLADRHSLILADKLSHYSLLQGALASRAEFRRFEHNDLEDLERRLDKAQSQDYNRILVVTETVFSMDGDRSDVQGIAELAKRYNTLLFVDDAHAVGVWGEGGRGLGYDIPGIDILLGTCGKALGSFGSYVACSKKMRAYLINFCPGFIYTTALPPPVVGAIVAAIDLLPNVDAKRKEYHQMITYLRENLRRLGYDTGPSSTQIIPIIIGSDAETLKLSEWLEKQGILATAIRPPTVPENSGRIRITISAGHGQEEIDHLITKLKEWKDDIN